ncbi:hypothetical protein PENTCL1PPCAC_5642 [Pristionchus entomophagus]|uniref:Uncharacterized protein n=1 Tax=Pristionchus entomophagus TaxID=358040 RepID=A0AAV5SL85_9BILA|nr:hypothetical protein PENTCL1PPCAC_5642 [Pristionchus entomophagus]
MEAVRKPKTKERARPPDPTPAPPLPARGRERSALDRVLPEVPRDEPRAAPPLPPRLRTASPPTVARERSPSPEPEEIEIPLQEQRAPTPPPTLPPRYISPRTNGVAAEAPERSFEAPPLPEKTRSPSTVSAPAPTVTHQPATVLPAARPAYPVLDTMPEASWARVAPLAPSGLPSYSQLSDRPSEKEREAWKPCAPREEAPPLYPSMNVLETTDLGLLSEQALLSFYHNELYEASDDLVDRFCREEERPNGPLIELLRRFKAVCDDIALSAVEESANATSLNKCLREVWNMQKRTHNHNDVCGENRAGSGVGHFDIAVMSNEKLEEMRKLLRGNRDVTLRKRMSQEVEARALALQIQWIVISVNTSFLSETRASPSSLPTLLDAPPLGSFSSPSRQRLRSSLSDLFSFLRLPNLPKRFVDAATAWVTELTCILHKSCLAVDGLWLLCHVLRMPSPAAEWTAPLIQTFVQSNSSSKLKMDYCIAMLAQLMSPIKSRESFLSALTLSNDDTGEGWMIVDEEGEKEHNPIVISETDLTSLLEQLPMTDFYSLAFLHFTTTNPDRMGQFVSLLAFQLVLMKIFHIGLETYSQLEYKSFCKQIGMTLRKSVRELASHWKVARGLLDPAAENQLQREMDRVVLLAVNYVISKRSLGLWQFLIDLPYDAISDECRLRVEYLLRRGGDEDSKNVRELFEMPQQDIAREIQASTLAERLDATGALDTVFLVNALAALVAQSSRDPTPFLREMVQVCFVDANTRDSLYKVGGEAIGTLLGAKPSSLDALITIIDRSIDHMEEHAVDIFSSAPLHLCKIGESVVGGVIGKWLIARSPERAGNRVARRILSALNWGYEDDGRSLWMSERVHAVCADTVLKAHISHCARSNGLIAKSVGKIAKLASKIPDYEQHFSQFCWDLLVKLKLPTQVSKKEPEADLAAYFLHAVQHSLASAEQFAESGLNYVGELVNAGCTSAAVVLITRAFALHYEKANVITGHKNFLAVFERVIHADQCSYAYQLLTGPSSSPTLIVRLIACAIVYEARFVSSLPLYLRAWVDALVVKRAALFNTDQVSLQLLGTITRLAFERDARDLMGITDQLQNAHMQILTTWRETSKGFLSMFSGTPQPPPLIPSSHLSVSLWSSFACLCVEDAAFDAFHAVLYDGLAKKDKTTVEEALKKASSKVSFALPMDRLPVFRWMELCRLCGSGEREKEAQRDAPVLALALQKLAQQMFNPRSSQGKKHQLARKFYAAPPREKWQGLEEFLESRSVGEAKGLPKAVAGWIRASLDISLPSFSDYSRFDLDYLLQLIIAEDKNPWMDFVDLNAIASQDIEDSRFYATACHERGRILPSSGSHNSLYPGTAMGGMGSRALPFPSLPSHPSLPQAPSLDRSIVAHPQLATSMVQPLLNSISKLAVEFVSASDKTEDKDREYCELLKKLYTPAVINIAVVVKCTKNCQIPATRTAQASGTEFNTTTDATMTKNREERSSTVNSLQKAVMDAAAVQTASIEFIARELCDMAATAPENLRMTSMQSVGRSLFFLITSSVSSATSSPILFPPATASLENALRTLGRNFIVYRPEEQLGVMKLVLDGFVLSDPLVESFSPECLTPALMVQAYERLSDAVAKPELSQRALMLLSRLSISRATSVPPLQFRPLMPLAFRNVAAATATEDTVTSPLGQLCMEHFVAFVFHQFPVNFAYGLELTLNGCNMGSTPPVLLESVAKRVEALPSPNATSEYRIDPKTSLECLAVTSRALVQGGGGALSSLFSRWYKYTEALGAMMQLFIMKWTLANFNSESPTMLIQNELSEVFVRIVSVFGPLLSPSSPSLPPFSPSHQETAGALAARFVATIAALPHNGVLPAGATNTLSLVWRFYAEQLAILTHGTMHYYGTIETYLVRLPWNQFWPSLRALQAMEEVLSSRSTDCAPFVAQVTVRVPWSDVLQLHVPDDLRPSYLSKLFLVVARLCAKPGHFAKVRASMVELLKTLASRQDWTTVSIKDAENIANTISVILPFDAASNPTEAVSILKVMWRKMCCFSSSASTLPTDSITVLKQCAFLRAELNLVIRTGSAQSALPAYNSLLSDVSTVAAHQDNLRVFCAVARELTCVWTKITDVKLGESLVTGWQSYLSTTPSSPLVLTCLNTIVGSLNNDQHSTTFKVMESTLQAYFKRPTSNWSEALQWVSIPEAARDGAAKYLFTMPNSDNKLVPLSLTLRSFIIHGQNHPTVYEKLLHYVTNVKPKYVEDESSFCALLSLLLQWSTSPSTGGETAASSYRAMMEWLKRVAHDERGGGLLGAIGLGKKNAYTNKLRIVLQLVELYLTQQRQSGDKSPELRVRRKENEPVMNSRVGAFKEMSGVKANASFSAAFSQAAPFFTRVETHHIEHTHLLLQKVAASIFGDPKYLEA